MPRAIELAVSFIVLIFLMPFYFAVAFSVWLVDGGPVIFSQVRIGRNGRAFWMKKFRTMKSFSGSEKGLFEIGGKSRTTPFGRILRKTKIDELPQLWNVLRGEMSFVGPRPEVRRWVAEYSNRWERILEIRPGMTDPASILYRHEEEILSRADDPENLYRNVILPYKLGVYEAYMRRRSCWGDVALIVATIRILFLKDKSPGT